MNGNGKCKKVLAVPLWVIRVEEEVVLCGAIKPLVMSLVKVSVL